MGLRTLDSQVGSTCKVGSTWAARHPARTLRPLRLAQGPAQGEGAVPYKRGRRLNPVIPREGAGSIPMP